MVVRYEEMHTDTFGILKRVLNFAGLSYSEGDIMRAVEAAQFDKMRSLEESFGVDGALGAKNERFVRRGRVGCWKDELDEECVRIIEQKYGKVMGKVGYEPSEY